MTDGVDWLRVPDAPRPSRIIRIEPPDEVDGFRFARVDDGVADDGAPSFAPERGTVTDPAERDRLLGFLGGGSVVLETDWYNADRIDPTRQFAVRQAYRTDGTWVWAEAVAYYLRHHDIAPAPAFRDWISAHNCRAATASDETVARAVTATKQRLETMQRMVDEFKAAHPEPIDTADLPDDLREALTGLGWQPGRDVSDRVDAWLSRHVDELADLPFERDGYPRYEPIPSAMAIFREFGGLSSLDNSPGITAAKTPFTIFPSGDSDLMQFAVDVQLLGERVGERVFQIGEVERGMGALLVDETGRVFVCGPVDLYLGADIHEGLTRLLTGIKAQRLPEIGL
ncbi:MAG TPA: SUKH-3 domain-containing protein [Micromonosporaceae bacterium]|jgi:hypothetical protein